MAKSTEAVAASDSYMRIVREFPLRHLKSDEELERATEVHRSLLLRGDRDEGEEGYFELLTDVIEKYEADEHPIPRATDAELVQFLIEDRAITQSQLAEATGIAPSTVSEVLAGKRELTRRQVGAVAKYFGLRPSVFSLLG